jgi:excisionase family DNA binding protein
MLKNKQPDEVQRVQHIPGGHAQMVHMAEPPLVASEAAHFLKISLRNLYELCKTGDIPCYRKRPRGTWRFFASELTDWIKSMPNTKKRR